MPTDYLPVPHFEQTSDGGCLPACAAMVLAYWQDPVDQHRLAQLLGTKTFGTAAPNIRRLIEWGYKVTYQSGSLASLRRLLATGIPPIVFVLTGALPYWSFDTPHAVVVVGINDQNVLVNDPAFDFAPQTVPLDAFLLAWSEFDYRYVSITRS